MSQARLGRAERSSSRFAGVTRVGLRVVVVAGIAGAAWALSATAANAAADPSTASASTNTQGAPLTSLVSLVSNVGTGTLHSLLGTSADPAKPAVTEKRAATVTDVVTSTVAPLLTTGSSLLSTVLAPTTPVHTGTGHASVGPRHVSVVPSRPDTKSLPAGGGSAVINDENGAGSADLVRTVTNLVAPLGLDQVLRPTLDVLQPMIGVVDPITAPLDQLLDSVAGVTTPILDAVCAVTQPVTGIATRSTDGVVAPAALPVPASPGLSVPAPEPALFATPVRVDDGTPAKRAVARHGTRGAPAQRSGHTGSDQHGIPASPVPLPALPAPALGGISTTGSGSHEGNGGVAILPTPVTCGVATQLRLARATGFAVRRLIVENPTVSPD